MFKVGGTVKQLRQPWEQESLNSRQKTSESGRLPLSPFPTDDFIASVPLPVLPVSITEHRYTWVSAQARTGQQDAPLPELSSHLPANASLESSHPVLGTQSYKALDQELAACSY